MRTFLAALLVLAALTYNPALASADEGLVLAGTCDSAGAWLTHTLKGVPTPATQVLSTPVDVKVTEGLKLREVTTGRPLDAKVLGQVKAGSAVKLTALRVLGAAPGGTHVVWAKITVEPDRIVKP